MQKRYSEITTQQKRRFYFSLSIFIVGFVLLLFIGNSINDNGFVILSLLAPLIILIGIIGISWSLYSSGNSKESNHTSKNL